VLQTILGSKESRQYFGTEKLGLKLPEHRDFGTNIYTFLLQNAKTIWFHLEIQLMIDVKIRLNSLHFKLERFDKVNNSILKSLIDLGSRIPFDEEELKMIHNLVTTLESVKLAVEAL
jgi:hypothetical protein